MFIPITKVDAVKREVWGVAAEEAPDKSGEIMDYAASKPRFEAWSKGIRDASMGKSLGNVRAMHGKVAAGKVIAINFDDAAKKIPVGVQVVDDGEWKKVEEGLYTGFSVGGSYGKVWADGNLKRYEAIPSELSLADNPCMYGATFTIVKTNGATELRKFAGELGKVAEREDTSSKEGEDKYGDVAFADEKNKKYPIDTEEHIRAAWNYINKEENAAEYSAEDVKTIKDRIVAAWKDKIDEEGPPSSEAEKAAGRGDLSKSIGEQEPVWAAAINSYDLGNVADALAMLSRLAASMTESDPACAAKITEAIKLLSDALAAKVEATTTAMAAAQAEEAAEAGTPGADALEMAVRTTLEKVLPKLLTTQVQTATAPLAKTEGLNKLESTVSDLSARLGAMDERLHKVESNPIAGPVLREIPSTQIHSETDTDAVLAKLIDEELDPSMRQRLMQKRTELSIRSVHARGGNLVR